MRQSVTTVSIIGLVLVSLLLSLLLAPPVRAQPDGTCAATSVADEAEGGELDIVAYGAAHLCTSDAFAFTFVTRDEWPDSRFSELYVRIDTDGNTANGCSEGDYLLYGVNRADDGTDDVLAGVFASPSCEQGDLEAVGLATVSRSGPRRITVTIDADDIGAPAVIGHYGSLSNPGEDNATADYAPERGQVVLDTSALPDADSVPVCVPDPTGDVVARDSNGQETPIDRPAADLTEACMEYGDGLAMAVRLPAMDFEALGPGAGPAALLDLDGDASADRILRAIWDGVGFAVQVTDPDGTVVCTGRAVLVGQVLHAGDLDASCVDEVDSLAFGIGMGAVGDASTAVVDRAGDAAFVSMNRAAAVDPAAVGTEPAEIAVADPSAGPQDAGLVRLAGPARIETSVAVGQQAWPDGAAAAVLARQDVEADALAGAALAAAVDGPLLLTPRDGLTGPVATELRRLLPDGARVYVLGGVAALSDDVVVDVQQLGFGTVRLSGDSRIETSLAIAREAATQIGEVDHVLVADAFDFPWALMAGAAAGANDGVVITTNASGLTDAARVFISEHPGATVTAVGPAASTAIPEARSIDGTDAYDTSVLLAREFFPDATRVGVASGERFPDGLGGGAFSASLGMPLLLTPGDTLATAVSSHLDSGSWNEIWMMGGEAALGGDVEDSLATFVD